MGDGVSREKVAVQLNNFKEAVASLPSVSAFNDNFTKIVETLEFLKICWNTTGGEKEYARLTNIVEELEELRISSLIFSLKDCNIGVNEGYHSEDY